MDAAPSDFVPDRAAAGCTGGLLLLASMRFTPALPALVLVLASACSSPNESEASEAAEPAVPLTERNIQHRVAGAMRAAGSFEFEWTDPPADGRSERVTTGAIEYGPNGVRELRLDVGEGAEQYVFVHGTMYGRSGGAYRETPTSQRSEVLEAWDWARAAESLPGLRNVTELGEDEIDGVPATEYRLRYRDGLLSWWVDEHDRLLKWVDDGSEGVAGEFGEPVEVTVPQ